MRFQFVLLVSLFMLLGCQDHGPVRKQTSKTWEPDATLLSQFQSRSSYEGYSIQLPPDFKKFGPTSNVKQPDGFKGKSRSDGTAASITISVDKNRGDKISASALVVKFIKGIERRRSNFVESPPEKGRIGSTDFALKKWTGNESRTGLPVKGSLYCAVVGDQLVTIGVQDVADAGDDQFAMAIAAALTFVPE
jgi:hypothetical protein